MKRAFAIVVLIFAAGLAPSLVGQEGEPPPGEPRQDGVDPFEPQFRRRPSASDADLEVLKRHGIAPTSAGLLDAFRSRTLSDEDRAKVVELVEDLGSPIFRVREKATDALLKRGAAALGLLREGAAKGDLELLRRAEACVERIRSGEPPAEALAAAARVLAAREIVEAAPTLLGFLPYSQSDYVSEEARAALRKQARRGESPHPAFAAALSDALPPRRAAAGEALAGVKGHEAAAKKLLGDPEPLVRARVAEALALAGDKSAIPALIRALPLLAPQQAASGEDLLHRLADGRDPPSVPRVGGDAARAKFQDAWTAWWAKNEDRIDLKKLHQPPSVLDHTVVVLLDLGRILELNAKREVVWQIDGVAFPLDVQPLPNGNVLVAEYHASKVTERDRFRGEIKWEKTIVGPLMAQRLANRNTFIATDSQLLEVDEKGNEVMSFAIQGGERFMKVVKAPSGEIVALTSNSPVVRLDEKGKELGSFNLDFNARLFGGRLHVSPNGRILVPHHDEDRVVEYDAQGQVLWEVEVEKPIAATKLPNGNVLVTTMSRDTGALEYDRTGRLTDWSFRNENSRVTRAIRR